MLSIGRRSGSRNVNSRGAQRPDVDVAERHRTVIALQHDGILARLGDLEVTARGARHFDGFMHQNFVQQHAQERRVGGLLATRVELRPPEPDM